MILIACKYSCNHRKQVQLKVVILFPSNKGKRVWALVDDKLWGTEEVSVGRN